MILLISYLTIGILAVLSLVTASYFLSTARKQKMAYFMWTIFSGLLSFAFVFSLQFL